MPTVLSISGLALGFGTAVAPPPPAPPVGISVPFAPYNIDGGGAAGSFTITWSAPTTKVNGDQTTLIGFNVRWGQNFGEQGVGGASELAGRISAVAAGTLTKTVSIAAGTYYGTVTAIDSAGESDTSFDFEMVVT